MNKTAIKNFAIWARNKLIADISYRAGLMGIKADGIKVSLPQSTGQTEFYDIGTAEPYAITGEAIRQRRHLAELIWRKEKGSDYQTAYKYIIEEVAYTWFNRLIAVRFMEVNDYLPSHIRVLSSDTGKLEPDLVTTPFESDLEFTRAEQQAVIELKNENKLDEVFRLLFIKQCNALNEILPALFEKTNDYTELLLNLSVIDQDGVVYRLVHDIPEGDFDVKRGGQVEIIGWLYQYYNTEPKNEAFAKKGKISKDEIPAVTQLFTPDWIVRYMVENSVGRLWIEHLRALDESADEAALAAGFGWKYYLPEAKQEPEVEEKLREMRQERASLTPEQITMIDPCMGSGHILVYAFDVLMQIYENAGYGQRDAARSILENNLFGLDIDDRAYQLAYFAVMMKAREYNRRILNGENKCKVYAIQESNGITDAALGDMGADLSEEDRKKAMKEIKALIAEFEDAKEYGSILNVEGRDWELLRSFIVPNVGYGQLTLDVNGAERTAERLQELISIAEVMVNHYLATVTNPPYMGANGMDAVLSSFVKENYSETKSDMSTVCMERCIKYCGNSGYVSMINIPVWMFLSSYEKLRHTLLANNTIINMIHPGRGIFGSDFGTTTFVIRKTVIKNYNGVYFRLFDKPSEVETVDVRKQQFLSRKRVCIATQDDYSRIPGEPIAYWLSSRLIDAFQNRRINSIGCARQGFATGDNDRFLRLWHEVSINTIGLGCINRDSAKKTLKKWFPCNKGGSYRKWFGNNNYVANWYNDGKEMRDYKGSVIRNPNYYFREGITWSSLSIGQLSMRYSPVGHLFESKGSVCFFDDVQDQFYVLGEVNSKVVYALLEVLCPTVDFHEGPIGRIPVIDDPLNKEKVVQIVKDNIELTKEDWDSFETSWDFKRHPMVVERREYEDQCSLGFNSKARQDSASLISKRYEIWEIQCENRFQTLRENEEELNHIFIDIYGLQKELTPEVEEKDVTVRKADLQRDIKSLLSYAVGCMFGRYSLDKSALAVFCKHILQKSAKHFCR